MSEIYEKNPNIPGDQDITSADGLIPKDKEITADTSEEASHEVLDGTAMDHCTVTPEGENGTPAAEEEAVSDGESESEADEDIYDEDEYDDENNLAAVAERITGVRHTVAATAAPVRVREVTGKIPLQPQATAGIPVREEKAEEKTPEPQPDSHFDAVQKSYNKRIFITVVTAALALIVILGSSIALVNTIAEKERPADLVIGDTPTENAEEIDPDLSAAENNDPADTDDPISSPDPDESTDETEPPVTETETETEPEPVKFTVTVDFFDKEDLVIVTEAITFGDLLAAAGCKLDEFDVPSVSVDTLITEDSVIKVDKRVWLTDTESVEIGYESRRIEIDTIWRGETNYLQYGQKGVKTITYAVEYINGVEVARTVTGEEITKQPVEEVYEIGVGGSFTGADGNNYTYAMRRVVPATYYNIEGLTYLGTMADETVIAVDKEYIPLGTRLYVKNDKYDFGVRIASDIGSAIKEWEIDIWIDDTNPQLDSFAYIGYHWDMEIFYID